MVAVAGAEDGWDLKEARCVDGACGGAAQPPLLLVWRTKVNGETQKKEGIDGGSTGRASRRLSAE